MRMGPALPDVQVDYRSWLRRRLKHGTRRQLANYLGRAESWLSMMLRSSTRRLTPDVAVQVADFLELQPKEREYFLALVEVEESNSEQSRARARATLRAHSLLTPARERSREALAVFAEGWYVGAVLELARCHTFEPSPRWIARTLRPSITVTQAARALTLLTRHGLLQQDGHAYPEADLGALVARMDVPELTSAVEGLHRQSTALVAEAAERFTPAERHLAAGFVALSPARFEQVRTLFREAVLRTVAEASLEDEPPSRVYHFVAALHPVSHGSAGSALPLAGEEE